MEGRLDQKPDHLRQGPLHDPHDHSLRESAAHAHAPTYTRAPETAHAAESAHAPERLLPDGREPGFGRYTIDDHPIEEAARTGKPVVSVYRPAGMAVVLGRGSRPDREIDLRACRHDRIPLLRRLGGGCAVLLDPGNLIVSAALPLPGLGMIKRATDRLTDWMIAGLDRAGYPGVTSDGFSDLVLTDRKIGGSCIYRRKGLYFYTTTLLFAPNLEAVDRYLKHPPREPEYRRGRSHREFMGSLLAAAPPAVARTGFAQNPAAAGSRAPDPDLLERSLPRLAIDSSGIDFA